MIIVMLLILGPIYLDLFVATAWAGQTRAVEHC
jgi:hypothetical protein